MEDNIDLVHYLEALNEYIIWLGDCRQVLERFYQTFNQTVLERNHHGFCRKIGMNNWLLSPRTESYAQGLPSLTVLRRIKYW